MNGFAWKMGSFILFQALLIATNAARAQQPGPSPIRYDNVFASRLFVQGFFGSVTIRPSNQHELVIRSKMRCGYEEPVQEQECLKKISFRVNPAGKTVEIRAELRGSKDDWMHWAQFHHAPTVDLDITAPATMAADIFWAHGNVLLSHWKGSVSVTGQQGKYSLNDISNSVLARVFSGSLQLSQVQGELSIENFNAGIDVEDAAGRVTIRSFSGSLVLKGLKKGLHLSAHSARADIDGLSGGLEADIAQGSVKVKRAGGTLWVKTETANLDIQSLGVLNAHLETQSGSVHFGIARGSKAAMNLSTEKGSLQAPAGIEVKKSPTGNRGRGVLKGKEPGTLQIVSFTGNIKVYTQ